MGSFFRNTISFDLGQALTEAPFAITLVCVLCLMMIQPSLTFITKMVMGFTVAHCGRVAATDTSGSSVDFLTNIAKSKLSVLPDTPLFYIPGSVDLEVDGAPSGPDINITLSLKQKPLPGLGALLGIGSQGEIKLEKKARVGGTILGVSNTEPPIDLVVGEGWQGS